MRSDIYWIELEPPARLGIAARPRSGDWLEDEISAWAAEGVDAVVTLLEPHETREFALEREAQLCLAAGIEFVSFPIPDRGAPHSTQATLALTEKIETWFDAGRSTLIHCRAGIGRSALIAACVLAVRGVQTDIAFEKISAARGLRVPDTDEQKLWVDAFNAAYRLAKDV